MPATGTVALAAEVKPLTPAPKKRRKKTAKKVVVKATVKKRGNHAGNRNSGTRSRG